MLEPLFLHQEQHQPEIQLHQSLRHPQAQYHVPYRMYGIHGTNPSPPLHLQQ